MIQLGRSKVVETESCRKFKSHFQSLKIASFTVVEANTVAWKYCNTDGILLFKSIHEFINSPKVILDEYSRRSPNHW